ncbi:peptidase [Phormidium sp. LEGE 05292]|uniref:peptidase n=1 Tax=[Phormidium] sp. LEGE 05292 TaxID=767427 RepID=UPI00187FDEB3|nr:peptidase [Phormidium sp. LEGE 05292]MBE9228853.1 peptidase [Phormidium sp. LEGE 05292]
MRKLWAIGLAVFTCILVFTFAAWGETTEKLPPLQPHPLPPSLAQWQDNSNSGDYFTEIKPTPAGYLVWSEFPIKVFVEPEKNSTVGAGLADRFLNTAKELTNSAPTKWENAALEAIKEWQVYLPLEVVEDSNIADILIWRSAPAWKPTFDRNTGRFQLPRARTAETRYQFYRRQSAQGETILSQRFTIQVNPNKVSDYILPTMRHELGHALGIWGHSPVETDALYFSQVRDSPPISHRDVNTLKRIYQQPTRLGWKL